MNFLRKNLKVKFKALLSACCPDSTVHCYREVAKPGLKTMRKCYSCYLKAASVMPVDLKPKLVVEGCTLPSKITSMF